MRWLVDGMNVIGSRPDGWWRDRAGAMRRLAGELDAFAAAAPADAVSVIFDGRPRDVGEHRRVAQDADPSDLAVVTSDRVLMDRVQAAGATVESVGRFRERLGSARRH